MLTESPRTHTIGDSPTAGMSASKATITVRSGLLNVRFSISSNMSRYNKGKGIEGPGIPPHQVVPYDAADPAAGRDTQITSTETVLLKATPSEEVDYVPPGMRKEAKRS